MAQVLNVQNRVVEHPNRYKLNPVAGEANTYDFEKVPGEISNAGTPYNRAIMNKIDCIMKYNEVTGTKSIDGTTVTYSSIECLDSNVLINNQRILVTALNSVEENFSDIEIPGDSYNLNKVYTTPKSIELSNGNIMIVGYESSTQSNLGIVDKNGTIIKEVTLSGNYYKDPKLVELSNGNILIVGSGPSSSYYGYALVVDNNGNTIKTVRQLNGTYRLIQLLKMSNGNVMIVGCNNNGGLYLEIVDNKGDTVTSNYLGRDFWRPQLIELSNGNIMIVGYNSDSDYGYSGCTIIVNKQGEIVHQISGTGNSFADPQLVELSNGNIMIVGYDTSNNFVGYICIKNNQNITIKTRTNIGNGFLYPKIIKLSNNNVMILGEDRNNKGRIIILDEDGDVVVNTIELNIKFTDSSLYKMSNDYIIAIGNDNSTSKYYITIFDNNGNYIKEPTVANFGRNIPNIIELSNRNIMIIGSISASSDKGTVYIHKIIYAPFNSIMLNNKNLDTLLKANKYYELIYDEINDRFIAEEVRNAN